MPSIRANFDHVFEVFQGLIFAFLLWQKDALGTRLNFNNISLQFLIPEKSLGIEEPYIEILLLCHLVWWKATPGDLANETYLWKPDVSSKQKKNIPPMKLLIRFPNPCSSLNDWLGRQRYLFTIHLAMELKLSIQSLLNLKTLKWSFRTAKSLLWKSRKSNPVLGFYEGVLIKMIIWA